MCKYILIYCFFWRLINKCSIQKSTFLFGQYSDFLDSIPSQIWRHTYVNRTMFSGVLPRCGNFKLPFIFGKIMSSSDRDNQRKVSIFGQVPRKINSLLVISLFFHRKQLKKHLKTSIYILQGLLTAICSQFAIIFILFA